ncbi:hypothetical protein KKC94_02730 [Patescibacteria group bacterium]|nr:hypothetical protein [Patescibacteria group bacterium]
MPNTFSIAEAQKSLVFVKPVMEDIQKTTRELKILKENMDKVENLEIILKKLEKLNTA